MLEVTAVELEWGWAGPATSAIARVEVVVRSLFDTVVDAVSTAAPLLGDLRIFSDQLSLDLVQVLSNLSGVFSDLLCNLTSHGVESSLSGSSLVVEIAMVSEFSIKPALRLSSSPVLAVSLDDKHVEVS